MSKNFGGSGARDSRKHYRKPVKVESGKGAPIQTADELEQYLSGDFIECLICGSSFKRLGLHLIKKHGYDARKYKEGFNIPVTRSLSGEATKNLSSDAMLSQWKTNPKYSQIRESLKNNPPVNNGATSRSTVSSSIRLKAARKSMSIKNKQQSDKYKKSRFECLEAINLAISRGITLRATGIVPARVRRYVRTHSNDSEFIELLNMVKKPRSNIKGLSGVNSQIDSPEPSEQNEG